MEGEKGRERGRERESTHEVVVVTGFERAGIVLATLIDREGNAD